MLNKADRLKAVRLKVKSPCVVDLRLATSKYADLPLRFGLDLLTVIESQQCRGGSLCPPGIWGCKPTVAGQARRPAPTLSKTLSFVVEIVVTWVRIFS